MRRRRHYRPSATTPPSVTRCSAQCCRPGRTSRACSPRCRSSVSLALESSTRINAFVEDYEKIRQDSDEAARALTYSAVKLFFVSCLVLAIALGAAFINFQLIALPMSELVPAGARIGGVPVSTVSALVLVLMEAALGIFLMDMLGVTELFPKLSTLPLSRRRLILGFGLAGLFFLASVESSLAILREQIVEAEAALKLSLAGEEGRLVQSAQRLEHSGDRSGSAGLHPAVGACARRGAARDAPRQRPPRHGLAGSDRAADPRHGERSQARTSPAISRA